MGAAPVMLGVMMIAAIFSFSPRSRPGHDPEYIASFDSCR
ncbi:hypothetical protein SNOG_04699 [Parastagonospora nodorum SN15]|uniref:Uncharacterized protein n=1 Tax=Phaeosphaeria nodorum (strain SN15 / ATCC MYA-4574 / FGSC 10173) TaxID=321614 RepID=Q0UU65_PHANO|nr:hypothetical protein SNOG_04699 [Parastagonospora nodorum SN15]EAT88459.1 hypothetical protein SNOG_04699 [Parastagonospora nodorum SN15]